MPAAERALEGARRRAHHGGSGAVEPRHLLLGLAEEEEGRAATLLTDAGLAPAALFRSLGADPTPAPPLPDAGVVPLGDAGEEALADARVLAAELSADRTVPSEALLVAVLRGDEGLRTLL